MPQKTTLTLLLSFLLTTTTLAFPTIKTEGLNYLEYTDMKIDVHGNVVVAGIFQGTVRFRDTTLTSIQGITDVFIAKYNPEGKLLWLKTEGGTNSETITGIAIDGEGNIFATGYFDYETQFGNKKIKSNGGNDVFIARYDTKGNLIWIKSAGGKFYPNYGDASRCIALDKQGNVYIAGSYFGTSKFENTMLTAKGELDIFIAKYDSNGNLKWVKSHGGTGFESVRTISVDNESNIICTGTFSGRPMFGSKLLTTADGIPSADSDIFITKHTSAGVVLWAQKLGGANPGDYVWGVGIDKMNNIYLAGNITPYGYFNNTPLKPHPLEYAFVGKLNKAGATVWMKPLEPHEFGTERKLSVENLILDSQENIYITGYINQTASIDDKILASVGGEDYFIAKLTNDGKPLCTFSGGEEKSESGLKMAIDAKENIWFIGRYLNPSEFKNAQIIETKTVDTPGTEYSKPFFVKLKPICN